MSVKIVTITAGHGGTDPGATNGTRTESAIAVEARNIIVSILKSAGIVTRTDGNGTTNLPLKTAITLVKGANVSIDIHCNAFSNKTAGGVEALAQTKDKALCQKICSAITGVMGNKVRGADGGWKSGSSGQHSRLGYVDAGGIVLELFFITNDEELKIWDAKKWLICRAVANVIIDHLMVKN